MHSFFNKKSNKSKKSRFRIAAQEPIEKKSNKSKTSRFRIAAQQPIERFSGKKLDFQNDPKVITIDSMGSPRVF